MMRKVRDEARTLPRVSRAGSLDLLVLLLAFLFHTAFFAWFPAIRSPNELTRVYLAGALLEDHSVQIDRQIAQYGTVFDVSERKVGATLQHYSDKAPGVALLALPALAAQRALTASPPTLEAKVRLVRLWVCSLPTLLLLVLLLRFLKRHLPDPRLPALLTLAYALGSPATPYASLALGHQPSAVVLFSAFLLIGPMHAGARIASSVLIGVLASLAVNIEYQNALLFLPLAAFFAWRVRMRPVHLLAALLGAAPLMALLLYYHKLAFGSPLLTGYSFLSSSFKNVHAQGMLGVGLPKASHAYLSFLSPAKGLFFFAPWLALSVPGLFLVWRSRRADLRLMALFVVLYALFVAALVYPVGGWTVSQRHLVPAVPFMVLPVGLFVARLERYPGCGRLLLTALALPALFVCGVSAVVWPYYQEALHNPFWQLGWPLFRDRWVVPSALNRFGVSSFALAIALLSAAGAAFIADLVRAAPGWPRRALYPVLALGLAAGALALARLPARQQDATGDRLFVERHYVHDPLASPRRLQASPIGKRRIERPDRGRRDDLRRPRMRSAPARSHKTWRPDRAPAPPTGSDAFGDHKARDAG
jgi:hypothetical protein